MQNLIYKIALTQIPGVGDVLARNLVSYCGGVEEVFKQKKSRLLQIPGIGEMLANNIIQFKDFKRAENEIKFIEKHDIKCMFYLDKDYPQRLKNFTDAPVMLYSLGNTNYDNEKIVGIVGTRKASDYGKNFTDELVETLAPTGALIISGLALGIDVAAHRSAVRHNL
nr:DNA-processing protein DprA [Bacteroidia bacterium]